MPVQAIALLLLLAPAGGALLLALGAFRLPRNAVRGIGPGVVWIGFLLTLALLAGSLRDSHQQYLTYWTWVQSGAFNLPANLLVDRLSIFMCLVITGVGGLIVTYATGYMEHETPASYARFFCYMDLFIFSMLLLVLAGNLVFLIIGWALVGLSSYLLIGFYYWRHSAVLAARKAFVMNVIGDIGLILGAFGLFVAYHQTTYQGVFDALGKKDSVPLEISAFLLLVGGIAKSAQLPLHTWLPDAMEGPTPVSALIHAATMVTAGVYLVGRMHPIYDLAVYAHGTVALVGILSAAFAATIAVVQTDIKRVLAYSTMSQIGYMFAAVGIGAYAAGFFHLLSHAFFKALLFMSAGNVIHALDDEQDMRRFGGLWPQMRLTSAAFLIGALSLAGILPLAGFFSKELILGEAFSKSSANPFHWFIWITGFLTAVLTAFYTGRMWWIAFWGEPSRRRPVAHPHEAPVSMLGPVLALAVLTVAGGFLQIEALYHGGWKLVTDFLSPVVGRPAWEASPLDYLATAATLVLSLLLFLAAYNFYIRRNWRPWGERFPGWQDVLSRKYYLDEAYDRLFVRSMDAGATNGERLLERPLIDGAVMGAGRLAGEGAGGVSATQSGYFRGYVLLFVAGVLALGAVVIYRGLLS